MGNELNYEEVEDVYEVDIEDLVIDPENIRGGTWDRDEELIDSIANDEVRQNLLVRPLEEGINGGVKVFGIMCGSRRFNAAIDAGYNTVPCKIRWDVDDAEAKLISMEENRNRLDTPTWKDVELIGEVTTDYCRRGMTKEEVKEKVASEYAMAECTISKYQKICELPEVVRCLLREYDELTKEQEGYLKTIPEYNRNNLPLKIDTVYTIWEYFERWSKDSQIEAAMELNGYKKETRKSVASEWKGQPDKSLDEVVRDSVVNNHLKKKSIRFEVETLERFSDVSLQLQQEFPDLVRRACKEWLDENGY